MKYLIVILPIFILLGAGCQKTNEMPSVELPNAYVTSTQDCPPRTEVSISINSEMKTAYVFVDTTYFLQEIGFPTHILVQK